jgi:hypothetical protein
MTSHSPSFSASPGEDDCSTKNPRVTYEEVVCLTGTTLEKKTVNLMILTAHAIVQDNIVADEDCDTDECTLNLIELYLSAHFVTIRDPELISEKLGDASDTYAGAFGEGLSLTRWGQQAKLLDKCGILSNLDNESKNGNVKPSFIFGAMGR